jgi:hypothetical protein
MMNMKTMAPVLLAVAGMLACTQRGHAMAEERVGPDPSTVAQTDWPKGIVELAKHSSRVYSIWVNGNEHFYFQAAPAEINGLMALFAKARMRDHEIRLESGTNAVKSFGGTALEYNVSLHILGGIALAVTRDRSAEETFEPVLTIYGAEDRSLLKQLKFPENAIVQSDVEGAAPQSKAVRPKRKPWYGCAQWEDAKPAVDFEHGVSTRITLWEQGFADGIQLGSVGHEGFFRAPFSEAEMAALKSGQSWLTVTVGNWLTEARKDDPKFPATFLAQEKENAKPLKIARPGYYYGRVLFTDGSPPVLEPKPWPGAEVWVDFPYAGMAHFDSEGYFKLFFGPEQFKQLKSRKPSKNIYVPMQEQGRSTATDIFPAELLSPDKAKAGVVKIEKPVFKPVFDPAKAPSLLGKPLPALSGLKLAPASGAAGNGRLLVCFFDLQARPSRHCLTQLVNQADDLKAKGLGIVAVQAAAIDPGGIEDFVKREKIPFPVGRIEAEEEKTRFEWGIKSLPWLILTDKAHVVRAEGFTAAEVKDRLKETGSGGD